MTSGGERWSKWGRPIAAAAFVAALATAFYGVTIPEPRESSPTHAVTGRYTALDGIGGRGFIPDGWHHLSDDGGWGRFLFPYVVSTDPRAFDGMVERTANSTSMRPLDPEALRGDDAFVELIAIYPPDPFAMRTDFPDRFPSHVDLASLEKAGRFRGEPFRVVQGRLGRSATAHLVVWVGPFASDQTRREVERIVASLDVRWRP